MTELKQIASILYDGFYCGGGGSDGNPKVRKGKSKPASLDYALKNFPYILGKIKNNIIITDYDSDETFQARFAIVKALEQSCIVIKSPHKGGHIYWFNRNHSYTVSNSINKTILTLSPVDYKCGIKIVKSTGEIKDSDCYGCLSNDDKTLRKILYIKINDDNTLDELPFYDLPMKSGIKHNFLNMKSGDGRQDGLFTYMNPLKAEGYSYEQFRIVSELIDKFIFSESLGDEFENAIRKEAWDSINSSASSEFFRGKTFLHDRFAEHLKNTYYIRKINGQLQIYKDGVYVSGNEEIEKCMCKEIPSLTDAKRKETLKQLNLICDEIVINDKNAHMIAFRNGVLNILDDSFTPFTPDHVITNRIDWDYNPQAYDELTDKTLDKIACNDKNIRSLLEECIGSCFYRSNTLAGGKAFILTGTGSNGKSTFIEVLQSILGENNYSVLDLKSLSDRFSTIMMFGKLANLGDDISSEYIADVSIFKKITRGNEIDAEQKGQPKFSFKPYVKLIFSANNIPRMGRGDTSAAHDRLLIIPFNAHFSKNDADYDNTIIWKLQSQEAMEYLIQLGIQGLKRVLQNKQYTHSNKVDSQLDEYRIENNPILSFVEEIGADSIENEPTKDIFTRYCVYCSQNGFKPVSNINFSRQICNQLNLKTVSKKVGGKKYQIFIKQVQDTR